jgi:undecaprenyl-diphosphatase
MKAWQKAGILLIIGIFLLPLPLLYQPLVAFDEQLFLELFRYHPSQWTPLVALVTELGSIIFWAIVAVGLWAFRKRNLATYLLTAILLGLTIYVAMKYAVDRPRPWQVFPIDPLYHLPDPSFPSGHSETAFAAAVIIGLKEKRLMAPMLLLASIIAFSRVYVGVHFPYDVVAGAILGILVALFVSCLDLRPLQAWIMRGLCRLGLRRECAAHYVDEDRH